MRLLPIFLLAPFVLAPAPAFAHLGHMADAAGHDHLTAAAAIGAAVVIGLIGLLAKGRDRDEDADEDRDETTEGESDAEEAIA